MACQRTSGAYSRSRPASPADRALGGALLFGYFLLGKQEKVTRSPGMASEKHRDVRRVSRNPPRAKGEELDPGFRRDADVGGFRRNDEVKGVRRGDDVGAFAGMKKRSLAAHEKTQISKCLPPSTRTISPVTNNASRNNHNTVEATSSGVPIRRSGVRSIIAVRSA